MSLLGRHDLGVVTFAEPVPVIDALIAVLGQDDGPARRGGWSRQGHDGAF
jgi:hypothetical protein